MTKWRFLHSGFQRGSKNMQVDTDLAMSLVEGGSISTVRVYGWNPWAISIGWAQRLEEIKIKQALECGIDVVRRPTGGRAILHADELTYAVAMPGNGRPIHAVYEEISLALIEAVRRLGGEASLERSQPHFPTLYREPSSAACFVSAARHEVKIGGKKLVGSAQRRYQRSDGSDVVLQHGSIPLGNEHWRIADFLFLDDDQQRTLDAELREKTTDLSHALGRRVGFDEVADAVRRGFERAWQVRFETELSEDVLLQESL